MKIGREGWVHQDTGEGYRIGTGKEASCKGVLRDKGVRPLVLDRIWPCSAINQLPLSGFTTDVLTVLL